MSQNCEDKRYICREKFEDVKNASTKNSLECAQKSPAIGP
jgi:hypothetical protein